jgi:tryptophan 2,3-dioxygenase
MSYAKPPVLSGSGKSDYENYLRTDELLSLQKNSDRWEHRDELLFTIVHQTSELWLKLATTEVNEAVTQLRSNKLRETQRLLKRVVLCLEQTMNSLKLLELMSPADYHQVRRAIGHGSGFDSPGFNSIRIAVPKLGSEFNRVLQELGVDLVSLFLSDRLHEDLYQVAESLLDVDKSLEIWRVMHIKVIARTIGIQSEGTQGTPVETLLKLSDFKYFPALWDVRNQITLIAMQNEGESE